MPRVGNRKSRTGCERCKRRRVKCDEQRPSCGWCTSHNLRCQYNSLTVTDEQHRDQASSLSQRSSSATTLQPSGAALSPRSRDPSRWISLELALMQYYIATVAPTSPYPDSHKQQGLKLHADLIPQEALRCPCLLHALFAYALLHMHIESSLNAQYPRNLDYFESLGLSIKTSLASDSDSADSAHPSWADPLSLHRDYLHRAIREQQAAIAEVNAQNADGVCLTSIMIASIALVHASQIESPHSSYTPPLDWFHLQRSFTPCLEAARPILTMQAATNMMIQCSPAIDNHYLTSADPNGPFWQLLQWQPSENREELTEEIEQAYARVVAYLQAFYRHVRDKEPWQHLGRRILAFPSIVNDLYVKLLTDCRPRALVLLAHLLAFGKKLDRLWWVFQGVSEYHVRGIAEMIPKEWQWALDWPMKVITYGIESCDSPG